MSESEDTPDAPEPYKPVDQARFGEIKAAVEAAPNDMQRLLVAESFRKASGGSKDPDLIYAYHEAKPPAEGADGIAPRLAEKLGGPWLAKHEKAEAIRRERNTERRGGERQTAPRGPSDVRDFIDRVKSRQLGSA